MTGRGILLMGLACITIMSCGGGEPYTSENHCVNGVCDELFNVTTNPYDIEGEGFITLSDNTKYFQYENGTPFIPIGHNEWYALQVFLDTERLDRYLSIMNEHGENIIRIVLDYQGLVTNLPFNFNKTNNLVELKVGEFNPES